MEVTNNSHLPAPFGSPTLSKVTRKGGARPGSGRPRKVDEIAIRRLIQSAIIKKYGSLREGIEALLESKDPALIKWVFERFFGKPTDKIDILTNSLGLNKITIEVVQSKANKDEPKDNDSI